MCLCVQRDTCGILRIIYWRCADVLEVNGLAVDWISRHIYWTDGRKRSVEVADFDGTKRRILITERLSQPRGIYADPKNGFVFDSRLTFKYNDNNYSFFDAVMVETPGLPLEFRRYLSYSRRYKYFRLGWPYCYFGCRRMTLWTSYSRFFKV